MPGERQPPGEPDPGPAEGRPGFVADAVRKAVLAGMGAIFLTEEGARKVARDWKLPKELMSYVVSQASGAKSEILRIVGDEIRRFMESDALRREFVRALTAMSIEVKAEIRLKDAGGGRVKPVVKATVRPRPARREPGRDGDEG
jgi:RecA/RadA recombinase